MRAEAVAQAGRELLLRGLAHGPHGGMDAAAFFQNLEVRHAAQLHRPLIHPVAGPAGVGVAVHETRHEHAAVGVDDLGIGGGGQALGPTAAILPSVTSTSPVGMMPSSASSLPRRGRVRCEGQDARRMSG
jgi:hypothetical protein